MNAAKLSHIVAIDHHGSISRAALDLGLTQSTLSRSLADIEREVGYALFDRRARDVVATERGRVFINRAARIISDLEQLSEDARLDREAAETLIRVGVSPASMQGLLNRAIKKLVRSRPDFRVHLEAVSVSGGVRALRRGDVDILVGPENGMRHEVGFVIERLALMNTNLFVRHGHDLSRKPTPSLQQIAAYPVIAPDKMSWHTDQLSRLYDGLQGDSARRMHIIEYFPLVADIVANSDAIGVVEAGYASTRAFEDRFTRLETSLFTPLPISFAVRKKWPTTIAVRAFEAALREEPPCWDLHH